MGRRFEYSIVDVFAERALEGNALAVFHDGRGLTDAEMQALARETNLSETTFVLPGENDQEDRELGVRVRIFTKQEELPFAGHPTLGTASWLHLNHAPVKGMASVTLREKVGPIPVTFAAREANRAGVVATMRQNDPEFGAVYGLDEVAAVMGVAVEDLLAGYRPQVVSTGMPFCVVVMRSVEAMHGLAIPQREASAWLRERGARWFYCVAPTGRTGVGEAEFHARMQFYGGEDPATGSAAGCCAAYLVKHGLAKSAEPVVMEQGVEILRPSCITVEARTLNETVCDVRVSGRTIPVASGAFFLP